MSVLGSGGVGKSALTLRFVRDYFVKDWDPTIEDAYRKSISVDEGLCMLEILDTAGQDVSVPACKCDDDFCRWGSLGSWWQDFESLRGQWMMDKDGYVFVYSMDSRISLHVCSLQRIPCYLMTIQTDMSNCCRNYNRFSTCISRLTKAVVHCHLLSSLQTRRT